MRYFDDLTRYKFSALIKKPIYGVHGELLIVRGDVLKEIWPNINESITVDFNFAMYVMKKGYWFFQSRTIVSIKSPNSLKDFVKQRRRWSNIIFGALKHGNFLVPIYAISGALVSPLFSPLWITLHSHIALVASIYYFTVYFYGGIKARLWYTSSILFISGLEALSLFLGIIQRDKEFIVNR